MDRVVSLSVGEMYHLGVGKDRIVYAGMPSENVYSFAQMKHGFPYMGFAWNLFYPRKKTDIVIDGVRISVENAGPDEIRFSV